MAAVEIGGLELAFGQLVTPIPERAFGVLHDVALMHEGDALALLLDGVLNRGAHQPFGARPADRFDAKAHLVGSACSKADLFKRRRQFALDELEYLFRLGTAGLVIDPGV